VWEFRCSKHRSLSHRAPHLVDAPVSLCCIPPESFHSALSTHAAIGVAEWSGDGVCLGHEERAGTMKDISLCAQDICSINQSPHVLPGTLHNADGHSHAKLPRHQVTQVLELQL